MTERSIQWGQSTNPAKPDTYIAASAAIPGEELARVTRDGDRWHWTADGEEGYAGSLDEAQDEAGRRALRLVHREAEGHE
jgi:hypothetical protein